MFNDLFETTDIASIVFFVVFGAGLLLLFTSCFLMIVERLRHLRVRREATTPPKVQDAYTFNFVGL